jgi:chromosomal replication initiator protein
MKDAIKVQAIILAVSDYTGIAPEKILSDTRKENIVRARHIAMWICRYYTKASLQSIASCFNCKRHATVIHAAKQTENMFFTEKNLKEDLKSIIANI